MLLAGIGFDARPNMKQIIRVYESPGSENADIQFADGHKVMIHLHTITDQKVAFLLNGNVQDYQATPHKRSMAVQGEWHTMTPADKPKRIDVDGQPYDVAVESIGTETKDGRKNGTATLRSAQLKRLIEFLCRIVVCPRMNSKTGNFRQSRRVDRVLMCRSRKPWPA